MPTFLGIDYATWWFLVIGGVFTGYAILDGFDLGAGAGHLFFRKEQSRRIALNAVGPVWDGNEVWLVIGGGALFAGFPPVYATVFSAMYIPIMLFLAALIFRAVSIEFRGKEPMAWWRRLWDVLYSAASTGIALLLGVVLGNVLQGMPLDERGEFSGSWLSFLNPYALLVGVMALALLMVHGAIYLIMKTEGKLYEKLTRLVRWAMVAFGVLFLGVTAYTLAGFPHLYARFMAQPSGALLPLLAILAILNVPRLLSKGRYRRAFLFSSLTVAFLFMVVAFALFPTIILASNDPALSLTVQNASASAKSLKLLLTVACIGTPLVLGYTTFVFYTFRGKVKLDETSY